MYLLTLNMPGYLPSGEPRECETFYEAIQGVKEVIQSYTDEDYTWHKWTGLSYLRAYMVKKDSPITLGIFMPQDSNEHTLGDALCISYVKEEIHSL